VARFSERRREGKWQPVNYAAEDFYPVSVGAAAICQLGPTTLPERAQNRSCGACSEAEKMLQ
jgi:hypothetical protein